MKQLYLSFMAKEEINAIEKSEEKKRRADKKIGDWEDYFYYTKRLIDSIYT